MKLHAIPIYARGLRLLLLCLGLLACLGTLAGTSNEQRDWQGDPVTRFRASLSRDELAWLDNHPVLNVGNGPDFQPFYAWREQRYTGPSADYLELLGRRTGLRFRMQRFDDFPAALAALDHGDIDLIPTLTPSEARSRKFLFTGGYLHSPAVVVTRSGTGSIALPADFAGVRVAVEKGHASREMLQRSKRGVRFVESIDTAAALRAVSSGEADAYVGMLAVSHYYIEHLGLANLKVSQRFDSDMSAMAMGVSRGQPQLHSILRKAMLAVSTDEGNALLRRYLPATSGLPGDSFRLSNAEQAWLRSHGPIRMGYDQAFYPLSYTNRGHQGEGYSIELFRLLRDKAGLTVEENGAPWSAVLKKAIASELDVLVAVANTPERREQLLFVGPYLSTPTVIVTRSNFQQAWDLAGFGGHKLALLKDHFLINRIRSAYPAIQLVEVPTQEEALNLVAAGSADVAIGNLHAVNRLIQSRFLGTLYIAGHVPDGDSELYLGVSKNAPELAAILRRALESVAPNEIAEAKNRWLDTIYTPNRPDDTLAATAGPPLAAALALLTCGIWSHRKLSGERSARRAAESRLEAARPLAPAIAGLGDDVTALREAIASGNAGAATELAARIDTTRQTLAGLADGLNGGPPGT